jgi:hypothetical protein
MMSVGYTSQVVAPSLFRAHHRRLLTNAKEIRAPPFPSGFCFLFSHLTLFDFV